MAFKIGMQGGGIAFARRILDHASVSGKEGGMISIALANPYNILKSFK